jgi:membrane-bound serine protease (ClpP class)
MRNASLAALLLVTGLTTTAFAPTPPHVLTVDIDGIVHPVTTEILTSAIDQATRSEDSLILIRLNTPGGLLDAMRASMQKIIASPIPVVTYVTPQGARAASAGFFLLETGDVAAMAPGTNTGAAHPVIMGTEMDPVMKEKLENDAAASLRSITGQRSRNVALAESAVRQSKSFTAQEALDGKLIDLIAANEYDMLKQLNGREIRRFNGQKVTLHLDGAVIENYHLSLRQKVVSALADPNLALIVLALGVLGIYVEFSHPGLIFPGVAGAILAVLGLAAFSILPLNWLGICLVLLAVALFALEVKVVSHGILSAGAAVALVLGATMLVDSPVPEMRIHFLTAIGVAAPLAILTAILVTLAMKARRNKVVTGAPAMLGLLGTALEDLSPAGQVMVRGEYWNATAPQNIPRGAHVRVNGIRDLLLEVEEVKK